MLEEDARLLGQRKRTLFIMSQKISCTSCFYWLPTLVFAGKDEKGQVTFAQAVG